MNQKNRINMWSAGFIILLFCSSCSLFNSFADWNPDSSRIKKLDSALHDLYAYQDESGMKKVTSVLEEDRNNTYALALQAAFALHDQDGAGAFQEVNEAISVNDDQALAHAIRAVYITTYEGNYNFAEIEAQKAIDADPKLSYAYVAYGQQELYREDYKGAQVHLEYALKLEPDNIDAYHHLCRVYLNTGEYQKALENINKAIKINPNLDFLYICKGYSHYSLGDNDSALSDFTEAINLETRDFYAYWYRAWLNSNNGDNKASLEDYLKAIELNPNDASSYNGAAYSMALLDQDLDKALEYVQTSLQLRPDSENAMDTQAFILYRMGNYSEAAIMFSELIEQDHTYSYYGRGMVNYETGNIENAISDFQHFLESNPDSPQCEEVETYLKSISAAPSN